MASRAKRSWRDKLPGKDRVLDWLLEAILPGRCIVQGALPGGYVLREPILVRTSHSRGHHLVMGAGTHGSGSSHIEAVEDFRYALVEYYGVLKADENRLAPHLQEHLAYLSAVISKDET